MFVWNDPHAFERLRERSGLRAHEIEYYLQKNRYVVDEWHRGNPVEQHFVWDYNRKSLIRVPLMNLENGDKWIPTILPVDKSGQYSAWRLAEAERAWRGNQFYRNPRRHAKPLATAEVGFAKPCLTRFGQRSYSHLSQFFSWEIRNKRALRADDSGVIELFRDHAFCRAVKDSIIALRSEVDTSLYGLEPEIYLIKPGAHRYIPPEFFLSTP